VVNLYHIHICYINIGGGQTMEVLFKAKLRIVFSNPVADENMKKKLDAVKVNLDGENQDILSISASDVTNNKTINSIVVVLSKTEKNYNLPIYLEKIRIKIGELTKSDGVKLIDVTVL
jgi:hypothetical protein